MIRCAKLAVFCMTMLGLSSNVALSAPVEKAQGTTIRVVGKLTEKSAFELQAVFVQNSGAKLTNYDYHDYKVILAIIPNVAPGDVERVKADLRKVIASSKIASKCFDFYISRAEIEGCLLHIVGEHTNNPAYYFRQEVEKSLQAVKAPCGKPYSIAYNCRYIYVPSIVVGEVVGVKPKQITYWINKRIEQDSLIYNNPAFAVQIQSVSVE